MHVHSLRVVYQCMQLSQTLEHGISFGLSMNYRSVLSKYILHTLCQWLCAVVQMVSRLPLYLYPVASIAGKELHSLAEEVVEILKGLAGREAFARVFAAVQKEVAEVRESRKRKKALDVCTNV